MKTNFLFKLLVVVFASVSLFSCTVEELTATPQNKIQTSASARNGEPLLTNPR